MPADMRQVLAQVMGQQGQGMPQQGGGAQGMGPQSPQAPQSPQSPQPGAAQPPNFQEMLVRHLIQMLQLPQAQPQRPQGIPGVNGNPVPYQPNSQYPDVPNYGGPPRG